MSSEAGKRLPTTRPTETAGLRWQPETWPMAKAMVRTVRPKAKATPRNPTLKMTPGVFDGKPAARTAVPQPPKTSQKVPKNSAAARLERFMGSPALSCEMDFVLLRKIFE